MASKNKEVRIEQRRVLEKKLELRLAKLVEEGVTAEGVSRDSQVKSLKSKIRETNLRIAAFDKNVEKVQAMKLAKEQKLAEKEAAKGTEAEKASKSKKKAASADKESKKKADTSDKSKKKKVAAKK